MFVSVRLKIAAFYILTAVFGTACFNSASILRSDDYTAISVPEGFPPVQFPQDNEYTKTRWLLGKKLFYDKSLSIDNSISCGSCHKVELAFSDNVALSAGAGNKPGTRNAPTLGNVAYHPYYTRDGGVASLEMQVLVPIQEHNEFNINILEIAERLKNNREYAELSKQAYNRELDYYVITRALANFERSLISGSSRYDRFKTYNERKALSESEKKGMDLFFSDRTNCSSCHNGFNFTNYAFESTGLYEKYADIGRKRLTLDDKDLEKFKVPSLRNIALTAPYMHDGSLQTLEEVVEHYNSGGKANAHKSDKIKPLNLSVNEKKHLIDFLKALTDTKFINNSKFKNS